MTDEQDMDALVEAASRDEDGFPAASEPVSPLVPAVDEGELKYIQNARQKYLETGRPPKGFGVRVYGDRVLVRKLKKRG